MANEIFKTNHFAIQVIASGSFLDDDPGFNGKTYTVQAYTIRLNHVALNEWILSTPFNDRLCYETQDEWMAYVDEKKAERATVEKKIADELHLDATAGGITIEKVVSEIFTVVYIFENT